MAISVIQAKGASDNGTTAFLQTFSAGITAGSIVVVQGWFGSGANLTSITNPAGNALTDSGSGVILNTNSGAKTFQKAFLTPTAGQTAFTMNLSASVYCAMLIIEVAGFTTPVFDKFVSNNVSTAGPTTWTGTSTGTLSAANEFAFGVVSTNNIINDGTSGWTKPTLDGGAAGRDNIGGFHEYLITSATTALVEGGNMGGNDLYTSLTSTIMESGGGGGPAFLAGDRILDFGLNALDTECDVIHVCSAGSITSYANVTSLTLGNKNFGAGAAFGAPGAGSPSGRIANSTAITNGAITTSGTVAQWAAVDSANSRLHAVGTLTGGTAVTVGQTFTLGSFAVHLNK